MATPNLFDPSILRNAYSVLVVDDNAAMKYSVARSLRAAGYRTVEASGGAEALELSEFVSAVVLDVHLPDLGGFEVCRLLRARHSTALLPVIHITAARVDDDDADAARVCGTDAFLVAPVDGRELARELDRLLAKRALFEASPTADDATMHAGDRSGNGLQSVLDQMTRVEKRPLN
ncbi:response regulator [Ramlibacter sp. XY19]|uniref:response regulator n=1 Tax=Ramlibacter paludis TaxID=2908000 RepID=UPI0023D97B1A|nr:response regulator [Ramlibacter paludis]MCG2592919.1 response regulator [Ramlibacter paludis]